MWMGLLSRKQSCDNRLYNRSSINLIEASTLQVGDTGRWATRGHSCRRFVVLSNDGFKINCRYLDNGEIFHTHGLQPLLKIEICWWMGVE